jgi:hypothetical protein
MEYEYMNSGMTVSQAYENGRKVAQVGQSIHANPFRNYMGLVEQYIAWNEGWKSGK